MRQWMGLMGLVLVAACALGEPPAAPPGEGPGAGEEEAGPAAGAPVPEPDSATAARAAELLARAESAWTEVRLEDALTLGLQALDAHPADPIGGRAALVAARAALALDRYETAREAAERARESAAVRADAETLARLAADALEPPSADPVIIGAVLPRTGPRVLIRYADWILEGIELAVAEAERQQGRRIDLVVADDSGGFRLQEAVRSLERRGALAIVGPLLPEHVSAAAGARREQELVLISPTVTVEPGWPETYSVNAEDVSGAEALGRYAAAVGLRHAALLYPRIREYERKAGAFATAFEDGGGIVSASVPYDSGTTTFEPHMTRILEGMEGVGAATYRSVSDADRDPVPPSFALFVPAPPRDVPQIAPQVSFYGLDSVGVQLFGDAGWTSAPVRRVVPGRDLEGVIAVSHFPPGGAEAVADSAFIRAYEARYRRSLENRLPALGYDAARLLVQALPNRLLTPDALARRFQFLAGIRGATGVLSVRGGEVIRIPYLVMAWHGGLVPAPYPWRDGIPIPADTAVEGVAP